MIVWRFWSLPNLLLFATMDTNCFSHWCVCTLLSCCGMAWTKTPVTLQPESLLPHQVVVDWLQRDYPHMCMGPPETMTQILTRNWSISALQLQDNVIEQLSMPDDNCWLYWTNCLLPNYIEEVWTNCLLPNYIEEVCSNNLLDGLYVLMVAKFHSAHIAIAHSFGVWSLRESSLTESGDLLIIASDSRLRQAMPICAYQQLTYDTSEWNMNPPMIRSKVKDIQEAQHAFKYCLKLNTPPCELLTILSDLFNMLPNIYRQIITAWMEEHLVHHPTALSWWSTRGQDWQY